MADRQGDREIRDLEARLDRCRLEFGDEAGETLDAALSLALCYRDRGWLLESIYLLQDLRRKFTSVLGPDAYATLYTGEVLGRVMVASGARADGLSIQREVLAAALRALGDDDKFIVVCWSNLADTYQTMGDFPAAFALMQPVIEGFTRLYGEHDLRPIQAMGRSARIQRQMGDFSSARSADQHILRLLESQHLDPRLVIDAKRSIASDLLGLGEIGAYVALAQEITALAICDLPEADEFRQHVLRHKRLARRLQKIDPHAIPDSKLIANLAALLLEQ